MRTTLAIDDDVLRAAKELASIEDRTLGEVISALARRALAPAVHRKSFRNGIPILPVAAGSARVTSELVRELLDESP